MNSMCSQLASCCDPDRDDDQKVYDEYINMRNFNTSSKTCRKVNKIVSPSIQSSSETSYNSRISLKLEKAKPFSPIEKLNYLQ